MNETDSSSLPDAASPLPDAVPVERAGLSGDHKPPRQHTLGTTALVLALIALCLSAGFAATAYFVWNQIQQLAGQQAGIGAQLDERLQPVRSSIEQLTKAAESTSESANRRILAIEHSGESLAEEQKNLDQRIRVLGALLGRSDEGWNLAEVEYLLGIANKQLQLQRDVKTAGVALQSADSRLRELSDPHYLVVREQIARDLDALARLPVVDVDGISIMLDAWMESMDSLPVAGTRYQPAGIQGTSALAVPSTAAEWKQLPHLIWELLKKHFRLREHDNPVKPMLAPEREYFLRENLRLQLFAAKLALLRDDTIQYRVALNTSQKWLADYFSMEEVAVSEIYAKLGELAEVEVGPELPDISGSLRLLRQQVKLADPVQGGQSLRRAPDERNPTDATMVPESEFEQP